MGTFVIGSDVIMRSDGEKNFSLVLCIFVFPGSRLDFITFGNVA